jgi:predicted metalloendopeptidase
VEEAADPQNTDYIKTLIADLYTSGMDEAAIEASSASTIKPFLQEIEGIESIEQAFRVAWSQKVKGLNGGFFRPMSSDFDAKVCTISSLLTLGFFFVDWEYQPWRNGS